MFHPLPPTFSLFSFRFCLVFVIFLFVTLSWYPSFHLSFYIIVPSSSCFFFNLSSAVSIEIIKILLDSSAPPTIIICFIFQVDFFFRKINFEIFLFFNYSCLSLSKKSRFEFHFNLGRSWNSSKLRSIKHICCLFEILLPLLPFSNSI